MSKAQAKLTARYSVRRAQAANGWTYAGLKANAALVHGFALPATFDSLTIRARCSPIELNCILDGPPQGSMPDLDERFRPKFAECLPDNLLAQFAHERLYDWNGAAHVIPTRIESHE